MTVVKDPGESKKTPPDPQGMGRLKEEKVGPFQKEKIQLRFRFLHLFAFILCRGQCTRARVEVRGRLARVCLLHM